MGAAGAKPTDAYLGAEQKAVKCSQLCCSPFATQKHLNPSTKIFQEKAVTQVRNAPSASEPVPPTPGFGFWRGWEQDEGMETPKTGHQGLERGLQKYLKS